MGPFGNPQRSAQDGFNPRTGAYHLYLGNGGSDGSLVHGIVRATAAITNTPVSEVDRIDDQIDTESLKKLFRDHTAGVARVSFRLNRCDVTVYSHGEIEIRPPPGE